MIRSVAIQMDHVSTIDIEGEAGLPPAELEVDRLEAEVFGDGDAGEGDREPALV